MSTRHDNFAEAWTYFAGALCPFQTRQQVKADCDVLGIAAKICNDMRNAGHKWSMKNHQMKIWKSCTVFFKKREVEKMSKRFKKQSCKLFQASLAWQAGPMAVHAGFHSSHARGHPGHTTLGLGLLRLLQRVFRVPWCTVYPCGAWEEITSAGLAASIESPQWQCGNVSKNLSVV